MKKFFTSLTFVGLFASQVAHSQGGEISIPPQFECQAINDAGKKFRGSNRTNLPTGWQANYNNAAKDSGSAWTNYGKEILQAANASLYFCGLAKITGCRTEICWENPQ